MNKNNRQTGESGHAILEFALVGSFLVPLFAISFTMGMMLQKGIQVGNVSRDAVVLMARGTQDPKKVSLDLSKPANQALLMRAAAGLQMNKSDWSPDPNGKGAIILSKVVHVGANECAAGIVPAPAGAPPWNTDNCPNYDSYVYMAHIAMGNTSTFSSALGGSPQNVQSDGSIPASTIASNTGDQVTGFTSVAVFPRSVYAVVSEVFADISYLNLFSIVKTPIMYARNLS
jgi:hypothetical protein